MLVYELRSTALS